jgi:DNA-binding beta-propeller fold protein YncE
MAQYRRASSGSVIVLALLATACGSSGGSSKTSDHEAGHDAGQDVNRAGRDASDAARDARRHVSSDAGDSGGRCPSFTDGGGEAATDPTAFSQPTVSCAYTCPVTSACSEEKTPYQCQNLAAWGCIPHAPSCGDWDGSYPPVTQGKCTATLATADALKYAGVDDAGAPDSGALRVLPDGRRMKPAGRSWIFNDPGLQGGLTTGLIDIPGTSYVLTVDDGADDHVVRLIDTTQIGSGTNPVVSYVAYPNPSTLNSGVAFRAPDLILVTTDNGSIQALTFDQTAATIANDDSRSLTLPASSSSSWYASGIAVSHDGTKAVVTGVNDPHLLVFDVGAGSATYGTMLGEVDLGQDETFAVAFDPSDTTGTTAYVSMWSGAEVLAVDVSNPASPAVTATYATGKDPEGMAFLDSRWMLVATDLGDSIAVVDRTAGTVMSVSTLQSDGLPGVEPIGIAYDTTTQRIYVPLAAANAVAAYDVDLTAAPPALTPAGRLPTSWWPSGVVTMSDGSVVVASMQGNGSGPEPQYFDIGDSDIIDLMQGGIQVIPTPSAVDLSTGDATVAAYNDVSALAGAPTVSCPAGVSDFPLPTTNTAGPSPAITHVFLFIRENKSFDGIFGDLPDVNGDPAYTLKTLPGEMDEIWANFRALGRSFAIADNFYTDAVYSIQGHMWDTYGRSDDFDERTWIVSGDGRNARPFPGAGVVNAGQPAEGSLFDWLDDNDVEYDILGEIVGSPKHPSTSHPPIALDYPGGPFQSLYYSDDEKGCYIGGRARARCDFGSFVYATLPNDHTEGVAPTNPAPETFCAINDEGTGMAVDAISHSPLWASSVIFITEDDPSQGGEHVDSHRTPIVIISPWVKRGYVSKTHFDIASLHKMFAHILGKPYPNTMVAHAAVPFDLFTSTPDFTPYDYKPRTFPLDCGTAANQIEQRLTRSWDFDDVDEQPGLDRQVTRWMRGRQLDHLTPRMERQIEARWERRLRPRPAGVDEPTRFQGGPVEHDDDGDDDPHEHFPPAR